MLTFAEAKDAIELSDIAGACPQSDKFRSLLNQATRKLMRRGNFFGKVKKLRVCVYDNTIVWPREVGTVLGCDICGSKLGGANFWYDFIPVSPGDWQWPPDFRGDPCGGNAHLENAGTSSVVANVPCNKNFYLRAYPSTQEDVGKVTWIFGTDSAGQEIRTQQADGTWRAGLALTLSVPYAVTPITIRHVDRITKDQTQGPVRYYFYDADNDALWDCATYRPYDQSPTFMVSRLKNFSQNRSVNPTTNIRALIALQFVPVQVDTDLVLIENLDALQAMMFSQKFLIAGDTGQAAALELQAVRELNYELRDRFPIEQFVSSWSPFGTAKLQRVTGGFI